MSSIVDSSVKSIPGFKVILKAVLKSQIQQLVDQLAHYSDEESVLVTFNMLESTMDIQGSDLGKQFLEQNQSLKSDFLMYCITKQDKADQMSVHASKPGAKGIKRKSDSSIRNKIPRKKSIPARYKPYIIGGSRQRMKQPSGKKSKQTKTAKRLSLQQPTEGLDEDRDVDTQSDTMDDPPDESDLDKDESSHAAKVKVEKLPQSQMMNLGLMTSTIDPGDDQADPKYSGSRRMSDDDVELCDDEIDEADEEADLKSEDAFLVHVMDGTTNRRSKTAKCYSCPTCEKIFLTPVNLKEHLVVHTGESLYQCSTCGISYKFRSNLTRHIKSKHARRSFPCTYCSREFSRKDTLLFHNVNFHRGELEKHLITVSKSGESLSVSSKDLQEMSTGKSEADVLVELESLEYLRKVEKMGLFCEYCGKMFNKLSMLEQHLVVHTKEKRFYCEKCGKGFTCKSGILNHRISKHNMGAKHCCDICGKCFISNSKLDRHRMTHSTGKKAYTCSECPEKCATWQNLVSHMQEVHGVIAHKVDDKADSESKTESNGD